MKTVATDGLVFLATVAVIAEFVIGFAINGGNLLPIPLFTYVAVPSTVLLGVVLWAVFLRHQVESIQES
jgi:ABC-type multidrug transport system permease subunit